MDNNPRAPATLPIHTLLDCLYDLQEKMSHTGEDASAMNVIEAHDYFSRESDQGRECTYALKARALFTTQDYQQTKQLFLKALQAFRTIEGEDFGTSS